MPQDVRRCSDFDERSVESSSRRGIFICRDRQLNRCEDLEINEKYGQV
ncbi:MAG: hypothetical protein NW224_30645 [Leptolyngbyaceae cyanobacterium bins.302]|nr:hypothetical protein [Leptolyngbyaceae cyanobacterium bins.302]